MRLLYCVMALVLSGCALETVALPPADDLTREPDYRTIVAAGIGAILGDPNKLGVIEISGARRTDSFKGSAWLVCVKSQTVAPPPLDPQLRQQPQPQFQPQTRYHSAFIQNEKVVDSRFAVTVDQCEAQSYTPFDWRPKPVAHEPRGRR